MKIRLIFNITREQIIIHKESLGRKIRTEFMMSGEEYLIDYLPDYIYIYKILAKKRT